MLIFAPDLFFFLYKRVEVVIMDFYERGAGSIPSTKQNKFFFKYYKEPGLKYHKNVFETNVVC